VPAGVEADGGDRAVDLGNPEDLLDLLTRIALRDVDGLGAEAAGLGQSFGVHVAHDHGGGAEQHGARCSGETHGPSTAT
jgi:hypothetical protein